jgi:predicted enzyme related to lactoylglutathione lyase
MHVTKHGNGRFCWAELSTSDGPGAKAFYHELMGWQGEDSPMGPDMVYTMLKLNGENVAALYEDHSGKAPPHWQAYISVDDVDASAARAKELGGTLLGEPFDVMEHGRMAVVQDPTGAVFCMWQPKTHIGYSVVVEPGAVCWNELRTRDTERAATFYSGLFGYGIKHSEMPMPYTEFQLDGQSVAGMGAIEPQAEGVPPHWNVYFTVTDCAATVDHAVRLGATTILPPMEIPGVGTMAIIKDPQGAVFAFVG